MWTTAWVATQIFNQLFRLQHMTIQKLCDVEEEDGIVHQNMQVDPGALTIHVSVFSENLCIKSRCIKLSTSYSTKSVKCIIIIIII